MKLSEKLLIEICKKSLENAKDLITDADLLKENNRIPRAYTLYQLATEEVGKAIYCYLIIVEEKYDDPKVKSEFEKVFISHRKKTEKSSSLNIMIAEVLHKGNFEGALNFLQESIEERNQLEEINNLKNNSLYTTIINTKVKNPSEVITANLLSKIELKAKSRFGAIKAFVTFGIEHLTFLREHQKANPNYELDIEDYAKEFWKITTSASAIGLDFFKCNSISFRIRVALWRKTKLYAALKIRFLK